MSVAARIEKPDVVTAPGEQFCFQYGDEQICFERRSRRKNVKNVLIKVHPDCRVEVSAPADSDDNAVLQAVRKRAGWISLQLQDFRQQQEYLCAREYISGESHFYLGKQYLLKVLEAEREPEGVKMLRGKLEVRLRQKDPAKVKKLLGDWYKTRAKAVFYRRLNTMLEQALWTTTQPPLAIRTMQTQWGSCSPGGRLTLNPHLVKAPTECIDYVILHELCHLVEHNHSERFYRLLQQVMPDWQQRKTRLDAMAHRLLLV